MMNRENGLYSCDTCGGEFNSNDLQPVSGPWEEEGRTVSICLCPDCRVKFFWLLDNHSASEVLAMMI